MLIDLDRVRNEPFHWQETQSVPLASLDRSELDSLSEITWEGKVVFTDPGYYLTGQLGYEQRLICTRCLTPFTEAVEADVELLLLVEEGDGPRGDGDPGEGVAEEVELEEEDLGVLTLTSEKFDTDPILREQLQLNIPMKPLCEVSCAGLCPVCGINRNEGECSCTQATVDPRWQALADLRGRLADED